MKISLIIVSYNAPDFLELIFLSLIRQSFLPYQVVVADDGSSPQTSELIERYRSICPFAIEHVWQPDKGFRTSRIRNKAILASTGDYIIFSDGDIAFHRHFLRDFSRVATPDVPLIGTRSFLSPKFTSDLLARSPRGVRFVRWPWRFEKNFLNSLRVLGLYKFFKVYDTPRLSLRGGLLGVRRSILLEVDGWDMIYEGWGSEDTDLVVRIINSGYSVRKLKHQGITFHLHHPINSRLSEQTNVGLLQDAVLECRKRAVCGLSSVD